MNYETCDKNAFILSDSWHYIADFGGKYIIFPSTVLQLILIGFTQSVVASKNRGVYVSRL